MNLDSEWDAGREADRQRGVKKKATPHPLPPTHPPSRRWQDQTESQMQLKETGGGFAVEASFFCFVLTPALASVGVCHFST